VHRTGHLDTFARDRLPPPEQLPTFLLDTLDFAYPERLNCVPRLLDRWVEEGHGDASCLIGAETSWSYGETAERVNRIARVLVDAFGLVAGNRVLLRAPNSPMLAAICLAVFKAGGIAVITVPVLRPRELAAPIAKAQPRLALCDARLLADLEAARTFSPGIERVVTFGAPDAELERLIEAASSDFTAADTADDDVCLLAFTSGTTGGPKATVHFHRDILAIADSYGRHVLRATAADRCIGSPPLAFTYGLGGLLIFPLAVGAATVLLEQGSPDALREAIPRFGATVLFTAPTAYRALLARARPAELASLRVCVSAGEPLSAATFGAWREATGLAILDGIGSTEMLHIFIGSPAERTRAGATGLVVPGYEARVVDAAGREVPRGTAGLLAVRGPTGCRYLDDARQASYVRGGWNLTGDTYVQDADGYFWYQARADDMIVSSGYNIAGPEVEAALLTHPAVAECAVVGAPDAERGMLVTAYVVLREGFAPDAALVRALQDHVKTEIAPYKYPRAVRFRAALPKTPTGKVQRAVLRAEAAAG
jgi:2-aminobenzoate-CoA ligase